MVPKENEKMMTEDLGMDMIGQLSWAVGGNMQEYLVNAFFLELPVFRSFLVFLLHVPSLSLFSLGVSRR